MSSTTYDDGLRYDRAAGAGQREQGGLFGRLLGWLARVGERSGLARQADEFQRLNALSDAQLARIDMKRSDLLERCYGWRAHY